LLITPTSGGLGGIGKVDAGSGGGAWVIPGQTS